MDLTELTEDAQEKIEDFADAVYDIGYGDGYEDGSYNKTIDRVALAKAIRYITRELPGALAQVDQENTFDAVTYLADIIIEEMESDD